VIFYRDAKVDDGRYANNGWMQELPDPITKMTWDNAVLISRKTARALDVQNGDIVEISLNNKTVTGPIWTQPGMADFSLGLALGYGRKNAGRVGTGVGFNAYPIFNGKYVESGATIRKTGDTYMCWRAPRTIGAWKAVRRFAKPTLRNSPRNRFRPGKVSWR
jgi:anaerobic selenocysteine-containing dehydrogenase